MRVYSKLINHRIENILFHDKNILHRYNNSFNIMATMGLDDNFLIMDKLTNTHSTIITLDADDSLFDRLQQINQITKCAVVEINSVNQNVLKTAIQQFPNICIGAGNITTLDEMEECNNSGVAFMTSPGFMPEMFQTTDMYNITYLPSIATISEAMQAMAVGCLNLRVLPTSVSLCTMINRYLPQLKLFPANVTQETITRYLALPFIAAISVLNPELRLLKELYEFNYEEIEF